VHCQNLTSRCVISSIFLTHDSYSRCCALWLPKSCSQCAQLGAVKKHGSGEMKWRALRQLDCVAYAMLKYLRRGRPRFRGNSPVLQRRTSFVFQDSITSPGERSLTTFHKRSALSGIRDAFAVSHLYSTCKSCYYKTGRGKAPIGGLRTKSPRSWSILTSESHYFVHNFQLYCWA